MASDKSKNGGGFDDVMKDMKFKASFSQRERNSSIHSIESAPSQSPTLGGPFIQPQLKPIASRQTSLPDTPFLPTRDRRASETDFMNQSRKNIVGELER